MAEQSRRDIVLVVDDSPDTLNFLTTALREAGIMVLVALDGDSALTIVERVTPDIILLDAVMPGADGFETCRKLKQIPNVAHIPVIFMTGLSNTEHVVKGFEAGGVDYVTKPLVIDELMARMRVHLANARIAQSARIALDAAGRYLVAVTRLGLLRWSTPQATQLLGLDIAQVAVSDEVGSFALAGEIAPWLQKAERGERQTDVGLTAQVGARSVKFSYLGKIGPDEYLLRLTEATAISDEDLLRQTLSITAREAEVLLWIARGKSNRNVAEILNISARTVDKHLEQIYTKLGIENRASATALVVKTLEMRR
ncbi:response regulator transcription factor [Methylovirgula sp. HY1]|uniref:response regulator transcription factor n=1 Tax=Methylovirgula sp. HY1 TaxID=2822761 RepID=UPI001C5B2713|nr:response regulator transcription factor [Methylovirgula sp. HY1]QXX76592.1 Response regulator PleD [Methylovirgula sp. HY1]